MTGTPIIDAADLRPHVNAALSPRHHRGRRSVMTLPHPARPHAETHFTGSEFVRDIVIRMSDGLTVPFALAAGLSGAVESSGIILTAGDPARVWRHQGHVHDRKTGAQRHPDRDRRRSGSIGGFHDRESVGVTHLRHSPAALSDVHDASGGIPLKTEKAGRAPENSLPKGLTNCPSCRRPHTARRTIPPSRPTRPSPCRQA